MALAKPKTSKARYAFNEIISKESGTTLVSVFRIGYVTYLKDAYFNNLSRKELLDDKNIQYFDKKKRRISANNRWKS
ncbi:hypothetical protein TEHSL10_14380 [Tetragenococcus halophilus]|nr:hypothetical protein TEHSL10_14380 [Tetragenococcus halophilus]